MLLLRSKSRCRVDLRDRNLVLVTALCYIIAAAIAGSMVVMCLIWYFPLLISEEAYPTQIPESS